MASSTETIGGIKRKTFFIAIGTLILIVVILALGSVAKKANANRKSVEQTTIQESVELAFSSQAGTNAGIAFSKRLS
jgi:uncharacterized membrane protein YhaH (DUF805 family)